MNERLQIMQQDKPKVDTNEDETTPQADKENEAALLSPTIELTGSTSESITLQVSNLLYIESVGNYVKVFHLSEGKVVNQLLRATSKQIEEELQGYSAIVRCHRAFLVNLQQVDRIVSNAGNMQLLIKHCNEYIPVSRSNTAQVKEAIKPH